MFVGIASSFLGPNETALFQIQPMISSALLIIENTGRSQASITVKHGKAPDTLTVTDNLVIEPGPEGVGFRQTLALPSGGLPENQFISIVSDQLIQIGICGADLRINELSRTPAS